MLLKPLFQYLVAGMLLLAASGDTQAQGVQVVVSGPVVHAPPPVVVVAPAPRPTRVIVVPAHERRVYVPVRRGPGPRPFRGNGWRGGGRGHGGWKHR